MILEISVGMAYGTNRTISEGGIARQSLLVPPEIFSTDVSIRISDILGIRILFLKRGDYKLA